MTDHDRPTSRDATDPQLSKFGHALTPGSPAPATSSAKFSGRTLRKSESLRAGVIVGTALVVTLGTAVVMGASPAPSSNAGASAAPSVPVKASQTGPRLGGQGISPGGPAKGDPRAGHGEGDGHGFGRVSVTAISGSNLSLATEDGWTRTITTTSATTITRDRAAATLADVTVGDEIRFRQTRNADGTYAISAINIVLPSIAGTVTAIGASTITITLRDGTTQTVATTGSTTYRLGKAAADRSNVTVGTTIVAVGENGADGSLTATAVHIHLPHVKGTVAATTADTITISRHDGSTVTIHVDSDTTFQVPGVTAATLADVSAGMAIAAAGTQRADGSIDASEVHAGKVGGGHGEGVKPGGMKWDGLTPKGTDPHASPKPGASAGAGG